mgnify:CR=1 FL=1
MFLVNGLKATLVQYNRNSDNSIYDDQDKQEISIKLCPYDISDGIKFGTYTILKVQDNWIFNRVENKILAVK